METKKKPTNAQLHRRIQNAVLHIDKTKDTQSCFYSDKGLRITVNEEFSIIETGFHRHVFNNFTSSGVSRPYLYTKRMIEITLDNDCLTEDGLSFAKLLETLKAKEDQTEYNIATYFSWYLYNVFQPLYSVGESEVESFLVYEAYLHNIARNAVLLSEKKEDMTNKQFFDAVIKNMQEFVEGVEERVIFPKKTDEEVMRENIDAIAANDAEQTMGAQSDGSQD